MRGKFKEVNFSCPAKINLKMVLETTVKRRLVNGCSIPEFAFSE